MLYAADRARFLIIAAGHAEIDIDAHIRAIMMGCHSLMAAHIFMARFRCCPYIELSGSGEHHAARWLWHIR